MPRGMTSKPSSDEKLALRAQGGCAASFEELVRRYQTRLLGFLRQRTANAADAEDLTQDTFARAYENLHRFNTSGRFSTWLFTIARRLCINHGLKKRPQANSEVLHPLESPALSPHQTASDQDDRRQLWNAAAEILTEQQVTAVWLYYVEDMSVAEIAPVVERSRVAVKMMLFRARKKLMPVFEELQLHQPNGNSTAADGNTSAGGDGTSPKPAELAKGKPPAAEKAVAEKSTVESSDG